MEDNEKIEKTPRKWIAVFVDKTNSGCQAYFIGTLDEVEARIRCNSSRGDEWDLSPVNFTRVRVTTRTVVDLEYPKSKEPRE